MLPSSADGLLAAGEVLFADVLLLPNGMSKVGAYTVGWLSGFPFVLTLWNVGLTVGLLSVVDIGMRVSRSAHPPLSLAMTDRGPESLNTLQLRKLKRQSTPSATKIFLEDLSTSERYHCCHPHTLCRR
jgi:hypothetical protein